VKIKWQGPLTALCSAIRIFGKRDNRLNLYDPSDGGVDALDVCSRPPDHLSRSLLNGFAAEALDRTGARRRDEEWIIAQIKSQSTRIIPLWELKNFFDGEGAPSPVFLSAADLEELIEAPESLVFLGADDSGVYFAIDLPSQELAEDFSDRGFFRDLKSVGALLGRREGNLLAYARAMVHWHRRHRFCGDCGSPTMSADGGHMRVCTNSECAQQHFPRTDPAIIVLVSSGERCLLARQAAWPKGMYSTIAGFVEPGETLENTVVREVWEETGIEVGEVHYHSSQPWPFPASVMLGFTARAATEDIRLEDNELEDAQWFSRDQMRDAMHDGSFRLPSAISIAYRLIEDWFDSDGRNQLRSIVRHK
jgi:NAD+ diphosphatase